MGFFQLSGVQSKVFPPSANFSTDHRAVRYSVDVKIVKMLLVEIFTEGQNFRYAPVRRKAGRKPNGLDFNLHIKIPLATKFISYVPQNPVFCR